MKLDDLVRYRYSRALETFDETVLLSHENHWNATANRLYYACFYLISALLINNGIDYSSHNGVKTGFHRKFIKTRIVSKENGKTYSRLFNLRHEGDSLDFKRLEKMKFFRLLKKLNLLFPNCQN